MKKTHIQLNENDRKAMQTMVAKGETDGRVLKRALALLALDRGETLESVAAHLQVTNDTVAAWRDKYKQEGLQGLHDQPRPGRPPLIDGLQRAQITALACSDAPEGHERWTLRMLADKIVELGYSESISHMQVGRILKKTK
jgi:putative transposase